MFQSFMNSEKNCLQFTATSLQCHTYNKYTVILCILYTFSILFRIDSLLGLWRKKLIESDTTKISILHTTYFFFDYNKHEQSIEKFHIEFCIVFLNNPFLEYRSFRYNWTLFRLEILLKINQIILYSSRVFVCWVRVPLFNLVCNWNYRHCSPFNFRFFFKILLRNPEELDNSNC